MLVAAAALLAFCGAATKHQLTLYRCPAAEPSGAHCLTLRVFENRVAMSGRRIDVAVVILPALVRNDGAVFPIAGGPGESAVDLIGYYLANGLASVRSHHDLVFVDQRGTGASNPLQCPTIFTDPRTALLELIPLGEVQKCHTKLSGVANLAMYGTDNAADDLDDVRTALAYDRIELFGGSYGTAVAQVYARRHPEHVRALLLQSVDTLDSRPPLPFAAGAQHALDEVMTACAAQSKCNHAFPALRTHFAALLARFDVGALPVVVRNLRDGSTQSYHMSKAVFADRLRQILYSPQASTIVPLILERAEDGDMQPLATSIAFLTKDLETGIAQGEWLSVTCAEDVAFISDAEVAAMSANSFLGDLRIRAQQAACKIWNVPSAPSSFIEPVRTNAPTLMISASDDPATPAQFAKKQLQYMPNARQVVVPNGGHDNSSICLNTIIASFLNTGNPKSVRAGCLRGSSRPPFVTDEHAFWELLKGAGA